MYVFHSIPVIAISSGHYWLLNQRKTSLVVVREIREPVIYSFFLTSKPNTSYCEFSKIVVIIQLSFSINTFHIDYTSS